MEIKFTPRQLEVGELLAAGRTVPEIAEELGIAVSTAENYVYHMGRVVPGNGPPVRRIALYFAVNRSAREEPPG